ncbi:hypothetical protein [Polaromonas sp.]|uniref:hypothetical protein n=1 Tax=Polaromonas sp. TaxID=1869339 RepID=UPI003267E016
MSNPIVGRRPFIARAVGAIAALPLVQACTGTAPRQTARGGGFEFGIVGDIPYTRAQEAEYARVMDDINARELAFVAHIGDCMFDPRPYERDPALARMPMTDENYAYVLGTFQSCRHPMVLTPGDNDWSDAVYFKKIKVDPLERLQKLRATFYPREGTLGQRSMAVQSQSRDPAHARFVENLTWSVQGLRFATLHIVGSDDNAQTSAEEHRTRQAAAIAWMQRAFATAKAETSAGLVLISHANPDFENRWTRSYASRYARSVRGAEAPQVPPATPYDPFLDALIEQMQNYRLPVLYVHGDTHIYRTGKPLLNPKTQRFFENLTRLETFGWPDSGWVRVAVNPTNPQLFEIHPEMPRANSANHQAT